MPKVMKRSLWIWVAAWIAWLTIQHASWALNWNGINLSNSNAICSLTQQMWGIDRGICPSVGGWWTFTTFLFWIGIGALAMFVITAYRARAANIANGE
jgi:hypothetical protein